MSISSGVFVEDVVSFGNHSELLPQRVVFGCENIETEHVCEEATYHLGSLRWTVADTESIKW